MHLPRAQRPGTCRPHPLKNPRMCSTSHSTSHSTSLFKPTYLHAEEASWGTSGLHTRSGGTAILACRRLPLLRGLPWSTGWPLLPLPLRLPWSSWWPLLLLGWRSLLGGLTQSRGALSWRPLRLPWLALLHVPRGGPMLMLLQVHVAGRATLLHVVLTRGTLLLQHVTTRGHARGTRQWLLPMMLRLLTWLLHVP